MSVYVGIDVHRKRSQVAVIDAKGEVLANRNVPNGAEPIPRCRYSAIRRFTAASDCGGEVAGGAVGTSAAAPLLRPCRGSVIRPLAAPPLAGG